MEKDFLQLEKDFLQLEKDFLQLENDFLQEKMLEKVFAACARLMYGRWAFFCRLN